MMTKERLEYVLAALNNPDELPIELRQRDRARKDTKNLTFTFYGRGCWFKQKKMITKVKLRARFYLQMASDGEIRRATNFEKRLKLELKIKNPSTSLKGVTRKLRVTLTDDQLIVLYQLKPKNPDFLQQLTSLMHEVAKIPENRKSQHVVTQIFEVIKQVSADNPEFTAPYFATMYQRTALVVKKIPSKIGPHSRTSTLGDSYQLTYDENVYGLKPQIVLNEGYSFLSYFRSFPDSHIVLTANPDIINLELKMPIYSSNSDHQAEGEEFNRLLVDQIFTGNSVPEGYRDHKGKMHVLKARFKEDHGRANNQ